MSFKRDVRRGLIRAAFLLLCLSPLGVAASQGVGGGVQLAKLLSLSPTLVVLVLTLTLLEARGARLPKGRPGRRLGVLLVIALVGSLAVPGLMAQIAYVEATFAGSGTKGLGKVHEVVTQTGLEALVGSLLFVGLPAAYVSFPRVICLPEPTASVISLTLILSLPLLLFQEACAYPLPAVLLGAWSVLYSAADGAEGVMFPPFEPRATKLYQRLHSPAGGLARGDLQLAASLGDGAARRALRLPALSARLTPEEFVGLLAGRAALGRVAVLLALDALPSAEDPSRARQACVAIADQLLDPSPEGEATLRELWSEFPWIPPPRGTSSHRTLHFALAIALAPASAGPVVLQRSIQSALRAALESTRSEDVSEALQKPLVDWLLDAKDPLWRLCSQGRSVPDGDT